MSVHSQSASVGGIIGFGLAMALFCWTVASFVWLAVRTWRNPDRFGRAAMFLSFRVGGTVGQGLARGIAVLAGAFVCLACFGFFGLVGMASASPGVWKWIAGAFGAGCVLAVPLLAVIVVFNRPSFLVVPYMRHLDRAVIRGGSLSLRERLSRLRHSVHSDAPD